MKILGIDYGTRRVGIAISDDTGTLAFPEAVFENKNTLFGEIVELCTKKKVEAIVLGESKNYQGDYNPIMEKIKIFKTQLELMISLPIYFEEEFLTSVEAEKIHTLPGLQDAQAAALILQRYLDRVNAQTR